MEMGENAAEMPREFNGLHCSGTESNELRIRNTEGTEKFPGIPRTSESETVIIAETETSLTKTTKSLTALNVASVGECVANDDVDIVVKSDRVASHECL